MCRHLQTGREFQSFVRSDVNKALEELTNRMLRGTRQDRPASESDHQGSTATGSGLHETIPI